MRDVRYDEFMHDSLSPKEIQQVKDLLAKLQPGLLPYDIFHAIMRLVVASIIEIVPLRTTNSKTEVLLYERPSDDPAWPRQLHTPGTVLRPTDSSIQQAIERVLHDELAGTEVSAPVFAGNLLHRQARGTEAAQIFWVEVQGEAKNGQWHDIQNLPAAFIKTQQDFLPIAVKHYQARS